MNDNTREKIKLRMLRRIAQLWDIEQPEYLDPIVKLLTEAMSEEIFALSGELNELDDRLLSKLSASMTPVTYRTARPSHAILKAYPTELTCCLDDDTTFSYRESKSLRKYNVNYVDFIPVCPFNLYRGKIEYLNICGQIYQYGEDFRKSTIAYPDKKSATLSNSLWIGIDLDDHITSLEDLSLYFDFINIKDKGLYLKLLSQAKWSLNGQPLDIEYGIRTNDRRNSEMQPYEQSPIGFILSDLRALYDIHYITINTQVIDRKTLPDELIDLYEPEIISQFTTPLMWIKIEFPASVSKDILEDIRIGMNMFPVANVNRKKMAVQMSNIPLFLPLETEVNEAFMEITSVCDSSGKIYKPLCSKAEDSKNSATGYYALRKAGVERHSNTNDSMSTMARMVDILRDHTLFSTNKTEVEFNQLINQASDSVSRISDALYDLVDTPQVKSYLIVDKCNPGETLFVDFLATNGAVINKFKPLISINSNINSAFESGKVFFVTSMRSGESDPSPDKTKDLYRYAVTSNDRIVTKQDVINYCMAECNDYICSVEVKSGCRVSKNPKEGLQKTIDLHIVLKDNMVLKIPVESFKTDLLCKLENRSPDGFNYQIFIN